MSCRRKIIVIHESVVIVHQRRVCFVPLVVDVLLGINFGCLTVRSKGSISESDSISDSIRTWHGNFEKVSCRKEKSIQKRVKSGGNREKRKDRACRCIE